MRLHRGHVTRADSLQKEYLYPVRLPDAILRRFTEKHAND